MIKIENLLVGSARHLELEGGLRPLEYLALDLVPKIAPGCDFNCIDCCNERELPENMHRLSVEKEINPILDEAQKLDMRVLVFMGLKEPTLDERFKKIVRSAYKRRLIPYVFSNGGKGLDEDMILFLYNHNASLVIQLKSLHEDVFEAHSRVVGSFMRVMKHLEIVRRVFSDTYREINGYGLRRVAINVVVDDRNKSELPQIKKFCDDDFVCVFNTEMKIGAAKYNPSIRATREICELIKAASPHTMPLGTTSNGNLCAYMRNGLALLEGEGLLCPYSLESVGGLGNVIDKGLKPFVGVANLAFDRFYGIEHPACLECWGDANHPRCILRDGRYKQLIKSITEKT